MKKKTGYNGYIGTTHFLLPNGFHYLKSLLGGSLCSLICTSRERNRASEKVDLGIRMKDGWYKE